MKCFVKWTSLVLVLVGALNWGLVGALDFNLVNWLAGQWPMVEKVVYIVVGIAAIVYVCDMCFCPCVKDDKGQKDSCCGKGSC